jgi:hypothetical protein
MTERDAFLKAIKLINEMKPAVAKKMTDAHDAGDRDDYIKWGSRLGGYIDVCELLYKESEKP